MSGGAPEPPAATVQSAAPDEAVSDDLGFPADSGGAPEPPAAAMPAAPPPVESRVRPETLPVVPSAAELTMEMSATRDCWVQAAADGDTVISRILRAGEQEVVVAQGAIELRVGDAAAFEFTINQRPGRVLGAAGEVVDVRVTPSNYLSFVAE